MKFRLSVSQEKYDVIEKYLTEHGVETGEDAEYIITEPSEVPSFLSARTKEKEAIRISTDEVVFIEAFGKDIETHTMQDTYYSQDRMYQLESVLGRQKFLRISKSVIISKRHVKKIRPTLSMKYILTLTDGTLVDVTRSYYSDFRKFFAI